LEPGRDGVGDYTRRLAGELIRQGVACRAIALNERALTRPEEEIQASEGNELSMLRLPAALSWRERTRLAKAWTAGFEPDWVSLQFVPFAFQKKGLPFGLSRVVDEIAGPAKRHVMFHELWVGCCESRSLKFRLWGEVQKRIIKAVARRATIIHTSNLLYQAMLKCNGLDAALLPLFGSFPVSKEGNTWLFGELNRLAIQASNRSSYFIVGMVGSCYADFPLKKVLRLQAEEAGVQHKKLVVIGIGRSRALTIKQWCDLVQDAVPDAVVVHFGEQSSERISAFLGVLDLGLPTTQRQRMGKSSIAAAMYEHEVPIGVHYDQPIPGFPGPWDSSLPADGIFQTVGLAAAKLRAEFIAG